MTDSAKGQIGSRYLALPDLLSGSQIVAHSFRKRLEASQNLAPFNVDAANKKYEFWQRDSLAVHLLSG